MSKALPGLLVALLFCLPASAKRHKVKGEAPEAPETVPAAPLLYTRSTEPIVFVWPPEGMPLAAEGEFAFGSVSPSTAHFTVNGTTVVPHPNGAFLVWLPVSPGTFTFHGELTLSSGVATADRHILVPAPPPAFAPGNKPAIDPASLSPKSDLELRAGDTFVARMRGTPAQTARYKWGKDWAPMRETSPGAYEAVRQILPGEDVEASVVEYELGGGWSKAHAKGSAKVAASAKAPLVATVKSSPAGFVSVKTGPANGFLTFPFPGTRLLVLGRENGSLKVRLTETLVGWLESKDADVAPGPAPRAVTGTVNVAKTDQGAVAKIGLSEKAAFELLPSDSLDALTLRVFGATGHTNWVINDATDFIREVRWRQESTDVVAFTFLLKKGESLWGWWPSMDGGALRLELRRAPRPSKDPFAGLKILLDPGHMPSATGATGPMGTKEMDANYAIAVAAKARLEKAGATVLMTREGPLAEVSLVDRPKQAVERGADLFVSIHNNALPDGENPFGKARGFTVFYYHPQSLELAKAVHAAYKSRVKLADEGVRWGNLLVNRQSAMPAILVENAYMIYPEQEMMLNDPAFRDQLAKALTEGIESFLKEVRRRP